MNLNEGWCATMRPVYIYIKQLSTRWQIPYKSCKVESKDQHHCKQNYLSSRITCHRHQQSSKIKKTNKKISNVVCWVFSAEAYHLICTYRTQNSKDDDTIEIVIMRYKKLKTKSWYFFVPFFWRMSHSFRAKNEIIYVINCSRTAISKRRLVVLSCV